MHLTNDRASQSAALKTIRELITCGIAGLDCYDRDVFIVDAATAEIRDNADVALDVLGAEMIRDGAYGAPKAMLQCRLPHWVRIEFGLDGISPPLIIVPLASRGVGDTRSARELAGVTAVALDRLTRAL